MERWKTTHSMGFSQLVLRVSRRSCLHVFPKNVQSPGSRASRDARRMISGHDGVIFSQTAKFSTGGEDNIDEFKYQEEIQKAQIKPDEFYEAHAENRMYFYHIDLLNRLYLEDTLPKNIATSLKSAKFLDFFWRMLRPNESDEFCQDYPFISPCGNEMNYVRPADTPIVFDRIETGDDSEPRLIYAATLSEKFDPAALIWNTTTGRLYHPVQSHKRLKGTTALIRSHLAVHLAEKFVYENNDVFLDWDGELHEIRYV
mmetsp:Transcript_30354/g.48364  ORF Transcript_30354/g.48364 Transcript_30354/m.48364 type:complete len:257 (+) Transcript_30354:1986-2756(+)